MNEPRPLSVRETAKGIAIRAGLLSVAAIIAGTWLFSLAAKAASGIVKIFAATLLLGIGGGFAAWEIKKIQRRLEGRSDRARLGPALD